MRNIVVLVLFIDIKYKQFPLRAQSDQAKGASAKLKPSHRLGRKNKYFLNTHRRSVSGT